MKLTVREIQQNDIEKVVDYFYNADAAFLRGMGADKSKLPNREVWISNIEAEHQKPYSKKENYYIIWLIDNQAVGHSNINKVKYGEIGFMHLHLWKNDKRKKGLGLDFLKLTIPYYFKNFALKKIICEPYSENIAPNSILKKFGFAFVKKYETIPGYINYNQTVNRYELENKQLS